MQIHSSRDSKLKTISILDEIDSGGTTPPSSSSDDETPAGNNPNSTSPSSSIAQTAKLDEAHFDQPISIIPTAHNTGSSLAATTSTITPEEALQAAAELQAFKALEARDTRSRRGKIIRIALIAVAAIAVIAVAFILLKPMFFPDQATATSEPTDFVWQGTYTDFRTGAGMLEANESVVVSSEVDGTIAELFVAEGDVVEVGQVLFTVDAPQLDEAIVQAERAVNAANQECKNSEVARDAANKAAADAKTAYNNLGANIKKAREAAAAIGEPFDEQEAQAQLNAAQKEYEALEAQKAPAQQQVNTMYLQLDDANTALTRAKQESEKRTVTSPIAGQVVTLNIERGMKLSTLASSGQSPLRIADLSSMRVTLLVNEVDISKLQVDQTATVTFDALPDYIADARVLRIAAVSSSGESSGNAGPGMGMGMGVVTFPVEIVIDNPDPRLKIGMSAQATIVIEEHTDVLIVNSLAIYNEFTNEDGSTQAYIDLKVDDGDRRSVMVNVIAKNQSEAAIKPVVAGDVKDGSTIYLNGFASDMSGLSGMGTMDSTDAKGAIAVESGLS